MADRISAAVSANFGPRDAEIPFDALAAQHGNRSGERLGMCCVALRSGTLLLSAHSHTSTGLPLKLDARSARPPQRESAEIRPSHRAQTKMHPPKLVPTTKLKTAYLPPKSSQQVDRPEGPPGGTYDSASRPHDTPGTVAARPALARLPGQIPTGWLVLEPGGGGGGCGACFMARLPDATPPAPSCRPRGASHARASSRRT